MGFHHLTNTAQFSYTGRDFWKNDQKYTKAPHGSRDYYEYWEREERRCLYGYKAGDLWIPGRMYFWLNFFPMSRVPEEVLARAYAEMKRTGKLRVQEASKIVELPKFWEVHYEWWMLKHIAWYGGTFMGIESEGNKHMAALKTRGAGWSYLEACDAVYNYNFIPGSKSYFFAGSEPFLVGDAIMDKVQEGLDWVNKYCPYWKQNRQVHKNVMHQRASYLDEQGTEQGTKSEIIAQIVDKPGKTRGKRGRKASFEESGTFPVLKPALEVAMGSMREGSVYVGQISVFGTGGEQGPSLQGLEDVFDNPRAWDMLAFPNIFDDNMEHTECGYFVPCYRANSWFMDEDGNVDLEGAIKSDEEAREKKRKSHDPKDLDRRKAEYPRTPREALQRLTGNGFNIAELDGQILRVRTSLSSMVRHGTLVRNPEVGVEFLPQPIDIARPILEYPHSQAEGSLLEGCISIVQEPYKDQRGNTPEGMYIMIVDTYYKEESEDQTSLWSAKIWKLDNEYDNSFYNLPVAWFTGRSKRYMRNHELTFMLSEMYNAQLQGEIAGGGQSLIDYARTHKQLHRLKHEPLSASSKDFQGKDAQNSYLMNMPGERKRLGLSYLEDWHITPRGVDERGNLVLMLHQCYDLQFLLEMRKHNPLKGNYDSISNGILAMYELKENYRERVQSRIKQEQDDFYSRELFSGGDVASSSDSQLTSAY